MEGCMGLAAAATAGAPPRHGDVSVRRRTEAARLRTAARLSRRVVRGRSGAVHGSVFVAVARTTGGTGRTGRGRKSGRPGYIGRRAAMGVMVGTMRRARGGVVSMRARVRIRRGRRARAGL